MIGVRQALDGIRARLRDVVLPRLEDEHARATVIAMLGILGDLVPRVREDEDRWRPAVEALAAALRGRANRRPADAAGAFRAAVEAALAEPSFATARLQLLEMAEHEVRSAWAGRDGRDLTELRRALAVDLDVQLALAVSHE
ncbi:MAG: hypothetical protein QOD06_1146 [Candidatus Binatota bacterium]|jgi:hypothetical protein|nr:hypothetical protein [Candidatus Binatota bacterium]